MSAVITSFKGTELFNTASFNNRISQINTGFSYISNPNLLDNWYFDNPVNQRGQTSYTGSVYMIDRWYADEVVLAISSGAIRVSRSSVGRWYSRIMQNLETKLSKEIAGKTCTLSALVKSVSGIGEVQMSIFNISDNVSTTNIHVDLTGGIDLITVTFVVPESYSGKSLGVFFYPDVNDSHRSNGCDVYAIKLELGPTQTLAHREGDRWVLNEIPDYGEQLRRCQRYFVNFNPYKMKYFGMPPGVSSNSTMVFSNVTLPVAMRAQPVVSYGGTIYASQQGNITVTRIDVTNDTFNGISVQLKYTVDGGLTANSMYRIQGGKDTSSYIHLSADL